MRRLTVTTRAEQRGHFMMLPLHALSVRGIILRDIITLSDVPGNTKFAGPILGRSIRMLYNL
jgi:hypothetical protein